MRFRDSRKAQAAMSAARPTPEATAEACRLARCRFLGGVSRGTRVGARTRRYPLAWVRARLCRSRLNAALARGADPCGSPALAYRSARLTSERERARLAASLDRVLDAAARPARRWSAAVPPCRHEVVAAGPLLVQAKELLLSRMPLYSQGAARLENLLRDGGGPLYWPARPGALRHELEVAITALEGREPPGER